MTTDSSLITIGGLYIMCCKL